MAPATALTPVLSRFWGEPEPWTLETYLRHDGYQGLRKALEMTAQKQLAPAYIDLRFDEDPIIGPPR